MDLPINRENFVRVIKICAPIVQFYSEYS